MLLTSLLTLIKDGYFKDVRYTVYESNGAHVTIYRDGVIDPLSHERIKEYFNTSN